MKTRYHLFASILAFAALPLMAETAPSAGEEVTLELQEIAQVSNRPAPAATLVAKKTEDCGRKNRDMGKKEALVMPEEQAIGMQKNVITPSVYPYVSNGTNTFATAEFLWWKLFLGGTGYAANGLADGYNVPLGTSVATGTIKEASFGFQPGCRIGIGTHFDHDGWSIGAEYTFLSSPSETNHIKGSPGKGGKSLVGVLTGDGVPAPVSFLHASSEREQDFNVIDLALARDFFISKYLTLKPNVGLKTAWIHETVEVELIPTPNTVDPRSGSMPLNRVLAAFQRRQQHMWGLGIRGGVDTMWHVTKNWAFYGDIAFTTMWSDLHIKASEYVSEAVAGQYRTASAHVSVQTVVPVIETGLGLSYINWFYDDAYRVQVQAGWEHQIWTDWDYAVGRGPLNTQGLTVKLGLTF
jgi:hypothetical protein